MRLAALGVAVCNMGLLMVGLSGTVGLEDALSGSLSTEGEAPEDVVGDVIDDTGDEAMGDDLDEA